MKEIFEIDAQPRSDMGKGASRRLRRQGLVPGIVYGAGRDPELIALVHNDLVQHLDHEAFYSHILSLKQGADSQQVILKDLQRHPAKPFVLHADFLRVSATEKLRTQVPIHFINEEQAAGVKMGGAISHHMTSVEITCLPNDLPEFIEVDMTELMVGDTVLMSGLQLPAGVQLYSLENDLPVVSVHSGHVTEEPEEGVEAEEVGPEPTGEE